MLTHVRNWILAGLIGLIVGCSGGGGGNSAAGVEPGPPPPGQPVPPPDPEAPNAAPYAEANELFATILSAVILEDGRALIEWLLTDERNVAITDLEADNVRFTLSKLQMSPIGNLTGTWQSYINQIEEPDGQGPGTEDRLQATYERDAEGSEFGNLGDGKYSYMTAVNVMDLPQDILDQAATEGLDLSYEPGVTHRVAMQFDGSQSTANPNYDWIPATGEPATFSMDIAATENCNRCHDPLAIHGPNRREVKYCVTCHNAGSTDAESTNTVDLKVMIHKIHMGENLPSVQDGGQYVIYGRSPHDYSGLIYPQDIRNCVNCHVGSGTVGDRTDLTVTSQGDNWAEVPSRAACGSCHENVPWDRHAGGQEDDSGCKQCHDSDYVVEKHLIPIDEARKTLMAEITGVENTMPGEFPTVSFKITNPQNNNEPYDIQNDPIFTHPDIRLAVGIAWDTTDYNNAGNFDADTSANNASQVQADALAATPNGDGSYSITMPVAIPDGSLKPGIEASGSGTASIEGHPIFLIGEDEDDDGEPDPVEVPLGDAHRFFSIDEADGEPVPRRYADDQADVLANCHSCHSTLVLHGNNRADNLETCATCHNPRNTDLRQRLTGMDPDNGGSAMATDGKREESIDFKTMIHGIHAPSVRMKDLQIVGFMAFNLHVFDEEHVHYPGNLANCAACHVDNSFALPLAEGVLATTIDTGPDINDPTDDTVVTAQTAVCSSCHDDDLAKTHMEQDGGGSFATTQEAIDEGEVVETCSICHGEGRSDDAWRIHQEFLE